MFDETIVLKQLETSGTIAYYSLIEFGYPMKISIAELYQKLLTYLEPRHILIGSKNCCLLFLLANGFLNKDFKLGKTEILIRAEKTILFQSLYAAFENMNNDIKVKFNTKYIKTRRSIIQIKVRSIGAGTFPSSEKYSSPLCYSICINLYFLFDIF